MATESRPSSNALLQPNIRRRVSTLNFGMVLIIVGFVGAIVLVIIYGISRMNAAPSDSMVNGGPVTAGPSSPQDLGMTGPSAATTAGFQPDTPVQQPARQYEPVAATPAPAQPRTQPAASGGAASSSADSAAAEASSQRREAQRRAADAARERAEQQQERMDSAMRSLGGVAIADPHDNASTQDNSANLASAASTATAQRQYAAPSGTILALDTSIPVALTRSIDSTFAGAVPLDVTANVFDETGRVVIIPQGSRCFATSSAGGVDGQDRIYVSVKLCKLPDRSRLVLDDSPVIDSDGATGVKARVDDHGAGRRNRGSAFGGLPTMLAGTVIPGGGVGTSVAMAGASAAQASSAGRAIPGPTLYVDATPQKPRLLSILVTQDTPIGVHPSEVAQ
jgi:type IV secretory pathway VirB10-like protein